MTNLEFWSKVGVIPALVPQSEVSLVSLINDVLYYCLEREGVPIAYFKTHVAVKSDKMQPLIRALQASLSQVSTPAKSDLLVICFDDSSHDSLPALERCLTEPALKKKLWQALKPIHPLV